MLAQNVEDFKMTRMDAATLFEEVCQAAICRFKPTKSVKVGAVEGAGEDADEEEKEEGDTAVHDALATVAAATAWSDVSSENYVSQGMTLSKVQLFILALSTPDKTSVPVSVAVGVLLGGTKVC